ncbi:MAG TPA: ABC transporter permease [Bryobacteraceae bacterium]|jgi:predicted permease
MHSFVNDLRYAIRQMRRGPAFAAVVIALIGIGIAANAAIFTLVDTLLLRKLPVRHPEELVRIITHNPPIPDSSYFEYEYWRFLRAHTTSFTDVIGQAEIETAMTADGASEFVQVGLVTESYFDMLGVNPAIGGLPRAAGTAILSDRFWRKRFNANPAVVGRMIDLNGHPFTITGVTAPDFHGTTVELNPDLRVVASGMPQLSSYDNFSYELVARLKAGVSLEQARSESISLYQGWAEGLPKAAQGPPDAKWMAERMQVERIDRGVSVLRTQFAGALELLMGGVGLVLLMVCSNVAGLLLERATARERETAVRLAVGASRIRLMRQWLTESLLLAVLGGVLGVGLAWLAMPVLASLIPPLRNRSGDLLLLDPNFGFDWRILLFSFAACVIAAMIAGFAPAWRAGRYDLSLSLRSLRSSSPVEGGITIFQVALCTLLLVEAGLFVRTLDAMRAMNVGFDRDHVVAFTLTRELSTTGGKPFDREQMLAAVTQIPGVQGAAFAALGLLRGTGMKTTAGLPGRRVTPAEYMGTSLNDVSPEYFDTMGIHVIAGRGLARTDSKPDKGILPAVVNQTFARRFFPGQDAVGQVFGSGSPVLKPSNVIVGVVSDSQYRSLREPIPPTFYTNGFDLQDRPNILHIRAAGDPSTLINPVREVVRKLEPGWSIREINLLRDEAERSIWRERLVAELAIGFAVVAGLLAAIGLYGTLAYYVSRNRRSIGIRVAIGAARANIVELLAGRVARLIAGGAVIGLAAAFALSGWVRALLFGVAPSDPVSMGVALVLLISIAAGALLLPAWRATRIDPAETLREE